MKKIWIFSKTIDLGLLFIPVWLTWLICFIVPQQVHQTDLPLWFWVVIILGIDVTHVWSTLFRTYLDKEELQTHKRLLILAPLIGLLTFFAVAAISISLFWTLLAYLAVFHFVKQQFGFMQIYKAKYGWMAHKKIISDKTAIYVGMLYPIFYWHLNRDRKFNWFIDGDFLNIHDWLTNTPLWNESFLLIINKLGHILYFSILLLWLAEEIRVHRRTGSTLPIGKVLWILTTAANWYLGIVYFNSDLAFSLTNVVAHGIPYLLLTFYYVEGKKQIRKTSTRIKIGINIVFMLAIIFILAFGEEYLWDMFLFRDNENFFSSIFKYPFPAVETVLLQAFVLSALSLPQVTHYILDGFIWKSKTNPYVKKVILK